MKRNWYAVFTKAAQEKRVVAILTKRKIENFLPLNRISSVQGGKTRVESEPLFKCFVFVYITETEMDLIKRLNFITNFVYWLGETAIFKESEIENLKHFTKEYKDIKLEKINVSTNSIVRVINSSKNITNDFIAIQKSVVKLVLPSLGYILISEISTVNVEDINYKKGGNLISQVK